MVTTAAEAKSHYIFTVAGNGVSSFGGDEGPATRAAISLPRGVSALPDGGFLVAEASYNTVRRIYTNGTIRLVAGDGTKAYGGDGGPATSAQLDFVHDVAALPDGGFLIADMNNRRIRRVYRNGLIRTVAGNGNPGPAGDGGPATLAQLNYPHAVAPLARGGFLIADTENHEVRRVTRDGTITTVAGDGAPGFAGDGGPATSASLNQPFDVAPLPDGGFLIADVGNHAIRKVSKSGRITTVAGDGTPGFSGDGGPARDAQLDSPHSVAVLPEGGYVIADTDNDRVRIVRRGKIRTLVGDGGSGYGGDFGPARSAELDLPKAIAPTAGGGFLIADSENERVRFVSTVGPRPLAVGLGTRRRSTKSVRVKYRWTPVTALKGGRTALSFRSTVRSAGTLTIAAGDGFREVLPVHAHRGRNRLALPPSIGPGRYSLRLATKTSDGQRSNARAALRVVGPKLGPPVAASPGDGGVPAISLVLGAAGIILIGGGSALALRERSLRRRDRARRKRRGADRTPV
jgi:hypothetical protein